MKNYKMDFVSNTVTVTKKFYIAATTNLGSTEFNDLMKFREMGMTVIVKAPAKRSNHRVTYRQMVAYISCLEDAARFLTEFNTVRQASVKEPNPYQHVCDWFDATFPNSHATPIFNEDGKIINFADVA